MKKLLFIALSIFVINLLRPGRSKKTGKPNLRFAESNDTNRSKDNNKLENSSQSPIKSQSNSSLVDKTLAEAGAKPDLIANDTQARKPLRPKKRITSPSSKELNSSVTSTKPKPRKRSNPEPKKTDQKI